MTYLPEPATERGPLQLAWESGKAVVVSEDQQLVKEAQRALLTRLDDLVAERFWRQFTEEFLAPIHQWCDARSDRVAACYVPFPRDHLQVFVVRRSDRYDFTLSPSDLRWISSKSSGSARDAANGPTRRPLHPYPVD